ncbi:SCAN domain-containing protein 3 [Trichonephila clavipes]|nr:SCAN domain-containing protein 3 [Trichonephila clavipes]
MPLSKNTVSRRIDEMGEDIEKQLIEKLKTRKFSVQMDESTLRDTSAKCECLFKLFCEEQNEDHVILLLHTEVRWLSKGNCLKRFMELFDTLSDFLNDKPEMKHILTIDGKAFVSYLADIFERY